MGRSDDSGKGIGRVLAFAGVGPRDQPVRLASNSELSALRAGSGRVHPGDNDPGDGGGLAEALPFIAVSLFAGHVADRYDRRVVAIVALIAVLGSAVALLFLPEFLGESPKMLVRAIFAVIVVSGFARSFLQPARQALGAELVPRELFAQSVTWRSGAWQLAAVAGPAIGGALYAIGGARLAYAVDGALVVAGILLLVAVRRTPPPPNRSTESISTSLMPQGLGLLRSAPAIGAVVTSAILAHAKPFQHTGRLLLRSVAIFGLTIIVFGVSTSFIVAAVALVAGGAADMVSVFIRSTLLTLRTPPEMLGRVMSVNGIFVGSSNEIGAFESGVTASWFGTVPSVVLGGTMTLVVVAVTAWRNPMLRRLGRMDAAVEVPRPG